MRWVWMGFFILSLMVGTFSCAGKRPQLKGEPNAENLQRQVDKRPDELSKESAEIHGRLGYTTARKDLPGAKTYKKFYGPRSLEESLKWEELFSKLFLQK